MPRKSKNKETLDETHPHLLNEWDYVKNNIRPNQVTHGSNKRVFWICLKCNYVWRTAIYNRTGNGSGCPACVNQVATKVNNLLVKFPEIADEWDKNRNDFSASSVVPGTNTKAFWRCKKCGNVWKAAVSSRTNKNNGRGCPQCAPAKRALAINKNKIIENGSLAEVFPELASEWDYTNNSECCPESIQSRSKKKVYWRCGCCNRGWNAPVKNRSIDGNGCPSCSGGAISNISQKWLDGLNVKIREHYIKELNIRVDGFDPETNTVYEFLGDYWHGNPATKEEKDLNTVVGKTYGELHDEWLQRKETLKNHGFNIEFIWESKFKENNG